MASQEILLGLAAVVVLGVAAQWLAHRLRLPSILLLLIAGFLAGGVSGLLRPDALLGDLLVPAVSLAVAIILFEGGLTLNFNEIRGHGAAVTRLVTVGAAVSWVLSALAARHVVGLSWSLSVLVGAILVVTGPTVVGPLLRHVRPKGDSGAVLKWEGILIDPVGALLALLVFEAINAGTFQEATATVLLSLGRALLAGALVGLAGAAILVATLRRHLLPDHLESPGSLAVVLAVYVASEWVQPESGLFAVTILGVALANQTVAPVRHIVEFKENLRVLIIGALFVLLAARISPADVAALGLAGLAFVALLMLVIRPLSVLASTHGSQLSWRERTFVSWMAPRGIVAASVASVFALRLEGAGHADARLLVPLVFVVIVATVTTYGLTAAPVARALGLAGPPPQGALVVGASPFARALAHRIVEAGHEALLVDTNPRRVREARAEGLSAEEANALAEEFRMGLDASRFGRVLCMTSNDEVNSLCALAYAQEFGRTGAFQVAPEPGPRPVPEDLRGRILFDPDATLAALEARLRAGDAVHVIEARGAAVTLPPGPSGEAALPLLHLGAGGQVAVIAAHAPARPRAGGRIVYLGGAPDAPLPEEDGEGPRQNG